MKKKILLALSIFFVLFCTNIFAQTENKETYWTFYAEKSTYDDGNAPELSTVTNVTPFRVYLVLNDDYTGLFVDTWYVTQITWDMPDDQTVSITDRLGDTFEGTFTDDYFVLKVDNTIYYMAAADTAPVINLAPECWTNGLPQNFFVESEYFKENIGEDAINELNEKAASISERFGFNMQIVLVSDFKKFTAGSIGILNEEIADGFQIGKTTEGNALILTMSIDDRDYDIYAAGGMGNLIFNEYSRGLLENEMLPYFKNNDWFSGFNAYLDKCSELLEKAENGEYIDGPQGNTVIEIILAILVGLIVAAITKSCIKSSYENKVTEASSAQNYIVENSFNLSKQTDTFTHTTTSKTYSPKTSSSSGSSHSGGSRSSSHSSGKF